MSRNRKGRSFLLHCLVVAFIASVVTVENTGAENKWSMLGRTDGEPNAWKFANLIDNFPATYFTNFLMPKEKEVDEKSERDNATNPYKREMTFSELVSFLPGWNLSMRLRNIRYVTAGYVTVVTKRGCNEILWTPGRTGRYQGRA